MNTQPTQNNSPQNIENRMRSMRTMWLAMLLSVPIYYVFTLISGPREVTPNNTLSLAFIAIGASAVLVSFFLKSKLLTRAIDQQQVPLVQQAYVVGWALAEVPALLAMLDFFVTGDPYYYLPLIIALVGQLLHFPRREHVEQAAFKGAAF